jgi:uncharacterized membrane protein YbhN (UPF0104 family)
VNSISTKTKNQVRLLRWAGSIISLGLLIYLFQRQGWMEIRNAFLQVSVGRFVLGLLLIYISRLAVIGRWHSLISAVEEVSVCQSIRITFAGLFASNFLPTTIGGDVVRLAGAVQLNIDGVVSAASLVVDRLIGMLGMFLAIPFGANQTLEWFMTNRASQIGAELGFTASWLSKLWKKAGDFLGRLLETVRVWSEHPGSVFKSLIFTGIHMICLFGAISLLLVDLGEDLAFNLIAGLWSIVYFITLLPVSINGLGVQEVSMAFIFSEVGGISLQNGLAVSVLFRTLMMLGSLPGAIFLPGIIASPKGKIKKES